MNDDDVWLEKFLIDEIAYVEEDLNMIRQSIEEGDEDFINDDEILPETEKYLEDLKRQLAELQKHKA